MTNTALRPTAGDSAWFTEARFGLFIHWGLYALAARHEWVQSFERIDVETYKRKYFAHFDPDLYDPEAWAADAADAGMKYFVVTTKHHDGFCLWDSEHTDYKATNTPAGRDVLTPMVEAFRGRGMRVGFYHSLLDWSHPDYIVDDRHSQRPAKELKIDDAEAMAKLAEINKGRDMSRYAAYLHAQSRELLTKFGRLDILWYDFSSPDSPFPKGHKDWNSEALLDMIRELQPQVLLNDRLDLHDRDDAWDLKTPEQAQPRRPVTFNGQPVVWEACQTFSGSWGYHRDEMTWRSSGQLIRTLCDCVSKNGNFLLNVGPTGRGEFDYRAKERLSDIGRWMRRHGRAIYGCGAAPESIVVPDDARLTYNAKTNRLYICLCAWPYKHVHVNGLAGNIEYAQLLHDASEVKVHEKELPHVGPTKEEREDDLVTIELPENEPPVDVPVIEIFLKKPPAVA